MSAPGWHCFQRPDQPRLGGGPALALGEKERAQKVIILIFLAPFAPLWFIFKFFQ
jgi:hypothetical protein